MRSYASSATTQEERTNVMANLSAYQGIGFILGPRNSYCWNVSLMHRNRFLSSNSGVVCFSWLSWSYSSFMGKRIHSVSLIEWNHHFLSSKLQLNIYTAPAFFSALTAVINVVLFVTPFKDVRVVSVSRRSISGRQESNSSQSTAQWSERDFPYQCIYSGDPKEERHDQLLAIICCLYLFFVAYLTFTNYET